MVKKQISDANSANCQDLDNSFSSINGNISAVNDQTYEPLGETSLIKKLEL